MNVIIANLGAAVAALLLMLLRKIMKNRISPRLFAAMWFLILLRVLVPVEVTTHISVFTPPQKTEIIEESSFEHGETGFENFEHDTVTAEHEPVQNGAQLQEGSPKCKRALTAMRFLWLMFAWRQPLHCILLPFIRQHCTVATGWSIAQMPLR